MSPILVRPVREQLEHDRIIRLLQTKFRRRYEAGMNPGSEQNVPVGTGTTPIYPDLVLQSQERGRKLQGLVEVETGESVNHLEALAQWAHFARIRAPFQLYVPAGMVDVARRLCEDNRIYVSEIWSYHTVGDQVRFTMVHRSREAPPQRSLRKGSAPAPKISGSARTTDSLRSTTSATSATSTNSTASTTSATSASATSTTAKPAKADKPQKPQRSPKSAKASSARRAEAKKKAMSKPSKPAKRKTR